MDGWRWEVYRRLSAFSALIACEPEHLSTIHGWVCWSPRPGGLQYIYVPPNLRGLGVGRALVTACERAEQARRWPWPSFVSKESEAA
jgi:GNAT superfamily N-acetyltransferase